jgi:YD repeat-containing protein
MKKSVLLLMCFTAALVLQGQVNNFNRGSITLPSPDATQFMRYGDIPMDYSTGVPGISIPLHTVTCGSLNLPIDISYNASGIKVLDIAGTVGLGWSLNIGGLISRTILGTNDQENKPKTFLSSTDIQNAFTYCQNNFTLSNIQNLVGDITNLYAESSQQTESQSDRFFYSFNGRSGIFRTDFQTGVAKTVPYSALKISTGTNNAGPYKITAEDGTNYYFGQPELSGSNPGYSYYTSYYLTKIESPDLTHTINIYYRLDAQISQRIKNYSLTHKIIEGPRNLGLGQPNGGMVLTTGQNNEFLNTSVPVMPDYITSDNETIKFEYIADRPDLRASRLVRIKILNRATEEVIKILEFQHSYFGSVADNNRRLRLNNLSIKDSHSATIQQYGFGYNSTALPPYYSTVPLGMWGERHNVDYWGYYNAANDVNLLPKEMFDPVKEIPYVYPGESYFTPQEKELYGGNRNPNSTTTQACILTEITYPTGGKTQFEYESNQVQNGYAYTPTHPIPDVYGGLRVKKITSTADATSPPVIKSYEYSPGLCTMIQSEIYQYNTPGKYIEDYINAGVPSGSVTSPLTTSTISTDPLIQMSTGSGSLVIYENVREYNGTLANNMGYTDYFYDRNSFLPFLYDPGMGGSPLLNGFYLSDYGNYKPQLKTKIVFGKDLSNNIKEIKKEEYTYNKFNAGSFITGVKIVKDFRFEKMGTISGSLTDVDVSCVGGWPGSECQSGLALLLSYYSYGNTTGVLDVPLLTQKKEIIYPSEGTGSLVTTTDYAYNLTTLQPIQEQTTNSKGETLISVNKYPNDFSSTAPYNTMVTKNVLTPIIEQSIYKNAVSSQNFLQSGKTNFDFWDGNNWSSLVTDMIVPKTIETQSKNQLSYETGLSYERYDNKDNILQIKGKDGVVTSYIWGYNKQYPVAKIIGKSYSDALAQSGIDLNVLNNSATTDAAMRTELNKLRSLTNCLVNTYTYKPLIGISSETDPNGKTIYYEYDAFNRLILIRDKDNNILKKICYNYAGQVENCSVPCTNFTPNWQNTTTALRCQQGTCGNTGYQEQEQKNINPCSSTYNSTQWILAGYNPTACPLPTCITLTSTNVTNFSGYTASYYNTSSGITYNFAVSTTGGLQTLGTVPAGNYTLTISRTTGAPMYGTFKSGCWKQIITGSAATFYNVAVSSTTCNSITVNIEGL